MRIWGQENEMSQSELATLAAHRVMEQRIPDLEGSDGEISLTKLVAYLTTFQKDIGTLIEKAGRIDSLIAKVRSSEAVTLQLTKETESLRNQISECATKMNDLQIALQSSNEKSAANQFVVDQISKNLTELTAQVAEAKKVHDSIFAKLNSFEIFTHDQNTDHKNIDRQFNQLREEISNLRTQSITNSQMLAKIGTTYKTIMIIIGAIGSLVGILISAWNIIVPGAPIPTPPVGN